MNLDEKEASAGSGRGLISIPAEDWGAVTRLAYSALGFGDRVAEDVEMTTEDFDTLKAAIYFASERLASLVGKHSVGIDDTPDEKLGGDIDQRPKPSRALTPFIARQWITLRDAAQLLAESNEGDCAEWADTLMDAADTRMIDASNWSVDPGTCPLRHEHIRAWCESHGYAWPVPLPEGRKPDAGSNDDELRANLEQARARIAELERERAALLKKIEAAAAIKEATAINSPTLQRIIEAVGAYPAWRAEWKSKTPPNLSHVEDWQKEVQDGARGGARLAYVAHIVIDEHFGLKT